MNNDKNNGQISGGAAVPFNPYSFDDITKKAPYSVEWITHDLGYCKYLGKVNLSNYDDAVAFKNILIRNGYMDVELNKNI